MPAKLFAISAHSAVNSVYDGKPYEQHLFLTVSVANHFIELIPEVMRNAVIDACWCHDILEETRLNYYDLVPEIGPLAAEIVFAVTDDKGRNRAERHSPRYWAGIRSTPFAVFVKVCDRIANIGYALAHKNHNKFNLYRAEHAEFMRQLHTEKYSGLFASLEEAIQEKI